MEGATRDMHVSSCSPPQCLCICLVYMVRGDLFINHHSSFSALGRLRVLHPPHSLCANVHAPGGNLTAVVGFRPLPLPVHPASSPPTYRMRT